MIALMKVTAAVAAIAAYEPAGPSGVVSLVDLSPPRARTEGSVFPVAVLARCWWVGNSWMR